MQCIFVKIILLVSFLIYFTFFLIPILKFLYCPQLPCHRESNLSDRDLWLFLIPGSNIILFMQYNFLKFLKAIRIPHLKRLHFITLYLIDSGLRPHGFISQLEFCWVATRKFSLSFYTYQTEFIADFTSPWL